MLYAYIRLVLKLQSASLTEDARERETSLNMESNSKDLIELFGKRILYIFLASSCYSFEYTIPTHGADGSRLHVKKKIK